MRCLVIFAALVGSTVAAQTRNPLPKLPQSNHIKGITEPDEPANLDPAKPTDFRDSKYKLSFQVPAGWNFEKKEGILSNFSADTGSRHPGLLIRGTASINYNPYPVSTFSGANFYYSVLPKATAATCAAQTATKPVKPQPELQIAGIPFQHGQDYHGHVCTESRDEVFTTLKGNACLRFDLVINTFCAETSGAMEITPSMLADLNTRLANILGSVKIDGKK